MERSESDRRRQAQTTQHVRKIWQDWFLGTRNSLDQLIQENPQLLEQHEDLADLVYAEYWLRKQLDDSVSETEYLDRFPQIAELLREQFVVGEKVLSGQEERRSSELLGEVTHRTAIVDSIQTVIATSQPQTAEDREFHNWPLNKRMSPSGFEPLCVLGVGGMGIVIKAKQLSLNRDVAIKSLKAGNWVSEDVKIRLRKEADVVGKLKSPHIVQLYDVVEEEGNLYLVMEYVQGRSLAQAIATTQIPFNKTTAYIRAIASAIEVAHQAGFLHRDIKPTNILLTEKEEIKVTDFGLARTTEESSLSLSGEMLGTPAYMAPEQIRGGRKEIDVRTDVYGIGATLYEALTGRPPFVGASAAETLHQVLYADVTPPHRIVPSIPRDLSSICLRCLEKSQAMRYPNVTALLQDIDRFLEGKPTVARPLTRFEKARKWINRNPSQFGLACGLIVSVVITLIATTWFLTRVANFESERILRDIAEKEAASRKSLSSFFSLLSTIQDRISEMPAGWTWQNEKDILRAVAFAPDESERSRLRDLSIRTMDGFDLKLNSTIATGIDPYGIAWSPDGTRLVIGENVTQTQLNQEEVYVLYALSEWPERTLQTIHLPAIEPQKIAEGMVEGIRSLIFLPDNKTLVIGCRSGWIQLYDFDTGAIRTKWKAHQNWCYSLAYDPKRRWIISGSRDGTIALWDADSLQLVRQLSATGAVKCLEVIGDHLVALGDDYDVFSLKDFGKMKNDASEAKPDASMLHRLPDNSLVLASKSKIFFQDLHSNHSAEYALDRVPFTRSPWISHMDASSDGNWLVVSGIENALFLNNRVMREAKAMPIPGSGANYVSFDRHGSAFWVVNNYRLSRYDQHLPELWKFTPSIMETSKRPQTNSPIQVKVMQGAHKVWIQCERFTKSGEQELNRVELANIPDDSTTLEQLGIALESGRISNEIPFARHNQWHIWDASQKILQPTSVRLEIDSIGRSSPACVSRDFRTIWASDTIEKVGRLRVVQIDDGQTLQEAMNVESAKKIRRGSFEDIVCGDAVTITLTDDHILGVRDSESGRVRSLIDLGMDTIPKVAALLADERSAIVGAQEGHLLLVHFEHGTVELFAQGLAEVTALAASCHGVLAVGYHSGEVELWSTKSRPAKRMCRLGKMENTISLLEFSKDGSQLAMLVQGEPVGRLLHWNNFRERLQQFHLDWPKQVLSPLD